MRFFSRSYRIPGVIPIDQYSQQGGPGLPTGCEMTAAAVLLNFYGLDATKNQLARDFLRKAPAGRADPDYAFLGNPETDDNSFGVYAPAAAMTMERFLRVKHPQAANRVRIFLHTARKSNAGNIAFTRTTLCNPLRWRKMKKYLRAGTPLMVWMTLHAAKPAVSHTFLLNRGTRYTAPGWGKYLVKWIAPQHCAVLCGYEKKHLLVCDVAGGVIRSVPKAAFLRGYRALGAQCIRLEVPVFSNTM